jgi:cytochrome c oxidase subunit II
LGLPRDTSPLAARPRSIRWALALSIAVALALAAPAEASIIGPEAPHSPNAGDMSTAYWVMLVVAVLVVLAVNAALVAAVMRFRAGRGRVAVRETAGRGVATRAAVGVGVLAVAILVFGVVMTSQTRSVEPSGPSGLSAANARFAQVGLQDAPPVPATVEPDAEPRSPVVIDVIGQQWLWRFEYPGHDPTVSPLFSYGELVLPVDTTVILNVTSTDVMHTWWIPSLGGQVQAVPGSVSQTWLRADAEGRYRGASTTFSGTNFPAMRAWVRVVSPDAYQSYVEELQRELQEAQRIVQEQVEQGTGPAGVTP